MIHNSRKFLLWHCNEIILIGTLLKGLSLRKVESHCFKGYYGIEPELDSAKRSHSPKDYLLSIPGLLSPGKELDAAPLQ